MQKNKILLIRTGCACEFKRKRIKYNEKIFCKLTEHGNVSIYDLNGKFIEWIYDDGFIENSNECSIFEYFEHLDVFNLLKRKK